MKKIYKFTKDQLTEAFQKWRDDYKKFPENFDELEKTKGEDSANTLIGYLEND